jgi:hypothetical protein
MSATVSEVQTIELGQGAAAREADRRKERRYAIPNQDVAIRIPPESRVIEAQVTDVSRNGVGLLSADSIDPGVQIMFSFGDQYVYARVRHCHPVVNGFAIGAAIRQMMLSH